MFSMFLSYIFQEIGIIIQKDVINISIGLEETIIK